MGRRPMLNAHVRRSQHLPLFGLKCQNACQCLTMPARQQHLHEEVHEEDRRGGQVLVLGKNVSGNRSTLLY